MLIDHPTIRLYLYLIGLTALAIAPLIALWQPEIATAIRDGANIFGATALGTAALNTPQRTPTTALTTTTTTQSLVNTNQPPHFCGGWFVSWGCDTVQGCGKNAVQYSSTDVEIAHQYELPNGVVVVGRPAHAGVNHLRHTGDYLLVSFPRTRGGLKASVLRYRGLRVFWTSGRGKDSPPHSHHLPTRLAGRPPWVPPGPPPDTPCPATAHHQAAHTGPSYQPTHDPKDAAPLGCRHRVRASS